MDIDETLAFVRTALENWDTRAAEEALRSALVFDGHPLLHFNLGILLSRQDRLDEAVQNYAAASEAAPGFFEAWINQGVAARDLLRYDEAESCFAKARALRPEDMDAAWQLGFLKLLRGQLRAGWRLMLPVWREWSRHWRGGIGSPVWEGEVRPGLRLLVHTDGGFGDSFMMARFLPRLAAKGVVVEFVVEQELVSLFTDRWPVVRVHSLNGPVPQHDVMTTLSSLPYWLGVEKPQELREPLPYLSATPSLIADWQERLSGLKRPLVGVVWKGRENGAGLHTRRDISLSRLMPLAQAGVSLVSLQGGGACVEALDPSLGFPVFPASSDFANTAAAIALLDAVVSIDTSIAHLAGALGRRAFLLVPYSPDWRWFEKGERTVWYDEARLFRQQNPGDWNRPVAEVAAACQALAPLRI